MNAPAAYLNVTKDRHHLALLNVLLSAPGKPRSGSLTDSTSPDREKAEEESKAEHANKPGGFKNDPDDPSNPNEVRERSRKQSQS